MPEMDNDASGQPKALQGVGKFSGALADAARRSRISSRTRRRMVAGGGFAARRHQLAFRLFFILSFVAIVLAPSIFGFTYFNFFASDQYVAEARFTVRGGEVPTVDGIGQLTGIPSLTVVQDTQIVTNYIQSRAIVEELNRRVSLSKLYSSDDADRLARFDSSKSIEKLVAFWKSMSDVSIQMPSGIIVLTVRAFRPEDSVSIADAVIALSELLVNDMNERMRRGAVDSSEQEFTRATERLKQTRLDMERVRNVEGILDAGQAAKAMNELVTSLQGDRIRLQQEYETQVRYVSEQAPQMRALKARITAAQIQLEQLQAKITTQTKDPGQRPLSESMSKFADLGLQHQIAERQYAGAAATLEIARATSERKQVYLNAFVKPITPQEPLYPKRLLYSLYIMILGVVIWGIICGSISAARNYMA